MNHNGFAPVQLTEQLPNLPSILVNKIPATEESESEIVLKHLNAMQAAMKALVQAENSERIKRALRHPVRSNDEYYNTGEKVFYKRKDSNRWRGSATVAGQDSKVVCLRHGSKIVRVAVCRSVKLNPLSNVKETIVDKTGSQANTIVTENKQGNETDIDEVGSIFDEKELNIESWGQPIENSQNPELVTDEIEEQNENSSEDQVKKTR